MNCKDYKKEDFHCETCLIWNTDKKRHLVHCFKRK
jgi:hypothetical protein